MPDTDQISRVAVKVPPFWRKDVAIWFLQVESQFTTANITTEHTKFHYVLGSLDPDVASLISDLLKAPLSETPYSDLKSRLIREFEESDGRKAKKLLTELTLGDKKPSALLREMRSLAGSQIKDDFLKTIFLQRLPENVSAIVTAAGDQLTLEALATLADKVLETTTPGHVYAAASTSLDARIAALEASLTKLTTSLNSVDRSRSRSRSSGPRQRSRSRHSKCWYHFKFGDKAKKCVPPCSQQQENFTNNH